MPKQPILQPKLISQSNDLQTALNAMFASVQVIYYNFQPIFKLIGLVILAYLAYKVGKLTVSQPIASKVKRIQKDIKKIQEQRQSLPQRIKSINNKYIKVIVLFVFLSIGTCAIYYTEQIKFDPIYIAPLIAIPVLLFVIKTIHISTLSGKSQQFAQKQKKIHERVKQINRQLGSKVNVSLKNNLCKDKILSKQNAPSGICNKKDCQQIRTAYRQRYQIIKNLAQTALQFQWCSTCKNRKPFDQLIRFQAKPMPPVRDGDISQQQDASMKINYLLDTLQQIDKWIKQAGPCNCSKLYMQQILKAKKSSLKAQKQVNAKIQQLQKQRQSFIANNTPVKRIQSKMSNSSQISASSSSYSNKNQGNVRIYPVTIRKNQ